jgi:hypothetical protein
MYVTTKATREQGLKAAAAVHRVMKRQACCKSQFKFKCFSCGGMINRGDKITKCNRATNGMTLRFRGADSQNGLTMGETAFYQAETGVNMWVHVGCNPCYWDSLPEDSNEYSRPALRPISTEWGFMVEKRFIDWCGSLPGHVFRSFPLFCQMKGYLYAYPKKKYMKDRIIHVVTRFQAIWRGYLYKRAFPEALLQFQAEQMYPSGTTGAGKLGVQEATAHEQHVLARKRRVAHYQELLRTSPKVGGHFEALFNKNEKSEAIYSGEVIEVQYRGDGKTKIKIKYHYDSEVKKYTGRKFKILKEECEEHKKKLGIEAKLTGRLNTARIGRMVFPISPSIQDWRYHYPDGYPVR